MENNRLITGRNGNLPVSILATCALLYVGKPVFVPLSFSVLISFILYPVCKSMEKRGIPRSLAIVISLSALIILLTGVVYLLLQQFISFSAEWSGLKVKLLSTVSGLQDFITNRFGLPIQEQDRLIKEFISGSGSSMLSSAGNLLYGIAVNVVFLVLIPILAALILYTRERWVAVLYRIFPSIEHAEIGNILRESITAYYNFIKGMGIVYLTVGTLNSIGLLLLGIPHAIMFGFIASVLTFIPYVGIMVASLLPITMAWLTYDSIWYPLGVVGVFTFVQYLEANLIFPLAVSSRLSINTLVTIVVILTGGVLWGAAGMILFIPYAAILKLIAERTPRLKSLSILLGNGPLPNS